MGKERILKPFPFFVLYNDKRTSFEQQFKYINLF